MTSGQQSLKDNYLCNGIKYFEKKKITRPGVEIIIMESTEIR